jgi:hypothetical protein
MPYRPQVTASARLIGELEAIAVLRERILAATVQVPWMPNLQRDARVGNTHSSTVIEGNLLTLERASKQGDMDLLNPLLEARLVQRSGTHPGAIGCPEFGFVYLVHVGSLVCLVSLARLVDVRSGQPVRPASPSRFTPHARSADWPRARESGRISEYVSGCDCSGFRIDSA